MSSLKITKKQLKQIAEREEAYYLTGNVYSYENCIYYLDKIIYKAITKKELQDDILELFKNVNHQYINSCNDLISNIQQLNYNNYKIEQLYYSAGIYGNSGQLHRINLYNNKNIIAQYYLYY